jgi:hypothetical protein
MVYVIESDRSSIVSRIRDAIRENQELLRLLESKYNAVMDKVNNEWAHKVNEYKALDPQTLTSEKKNEYMEYFKNCKKEVHNTLTLADYKYVLYEDRYFQLVNFDDYNNECYHEIPNLSDLNDEQITDLLLARAHKDKPRFEEILNFLLNSINGTPSIKNLCKILHIESRYYPINMTRSWDKNALVKEKVTLKVGPIKTKDRGLQKVIETKDKTIALLDTLRATILCRDPSVPLIIMEYLKNEGLLSRLKNKTKPENEYKCVHINFSLGEKGHRTQYELQLIFEEYYELQKRDHEYYELIR